MLTNKKEIRVLFITPIFAPQVGGAATYSKYLVDKLSCFARMKKLVILTTFMPKERLYASAGKIDVLRILPLIDNPASKILDFISKALSNFLVLICLPVITFFYRIEIIHYLRPKIHPAISLLVRARIINRPVVLDQRDLSTKTPNHKSYDKVICAGKNIVQLMKSKEVPKYKIEYLPTPLILPSEKSVNCGEINGNYNPPRPYILYLGNIESEKGVYELIEAMSFLSKEDLTLVFAGPNHEGRRFLKQINNSRNIQYIGAIPHTVALSLLQHAELVVLPSKAEGIPRSCLEAIALGKKVLCPPGIPEFEKFCADFVLPEISAEVIADKILEHLKNDKYPNYPIEMHSWEVLSKKLLKLYDELSQKRRYG